MMSVQNSVTLLPIGEEGKQDYERDQEDELLVANDATQNGRFSVGIGGGDCRTSLSQDRHARILFYASASRG
jgi:hypothetical protein